MNHEQHPPGGDQQPDVNSYGTDDPDKQAEIEQARIDASRERTRDRARLEQLVEHGMSPGDAEAVIEFEHAAREQHHRHVRTAHTNESAAEATGPETGPRYRPRIYVVDSTIPEHDQHGWWIDASESVSQMQTDIAAMLATSPRAEATEWTIRACEAFAGLDVTGFTDLDLVARLARGVAEHGAAYAAWAELVSSSDPDQLDKFEDFYIGSFASPEAWARSVGEDMEWDRHLDEVVDPTLRPYLVIDYAAFAQEQRQAWDVLQGSDGRTHVFMR